MGKFLQPCMDCQKLSRGGRCPECQLRVDRARQAKADANPIRQARKALLYGSEYKRRAKLVKANATHCFICKKPFIETDTIHADHLIPGEGGSPLVPAHKFCNESKGNRTNVRPNYT